jgi:hypothetical protein
MRYVGLRPASTPPHYVRVGQAPSHGPDCAPVRYQTIDIPPGDAGIERTARIMRDLILEGQGHPVVREHAERAVAGLPPGHPADEVRGVYDYIGANSDYRRDPVINEWIRTPWYLLKCEIEPWQARQRARKPQLDCDDLTGVSLAMLASIGFDTVIRVVSTLVTKQYNHVYGLAWLDRSRVLPIDLTRFRVAPSTPWPREYRAFEVAV